ncbi:MAG: glycoside hydrolase family 92 protein [Draconibacterium sp.]|nr:glycoside hydrolase family 92 protein [Draconibacterium sp.]
MVAEVDTCFVSFQIPEMCNFTKSPWKTQKKIRSMLNMWFKDNIFGISGEEDSDVMSAFVVFSAMGYYPITPIIPVYTIGSLLLSKITINLPNQEQFIVSVPNCSDKNKYIQSAKLSGEVLDTPWFTHEQLMNGGVIKLEMCAHPNRSVCLSESEYPKNFKFICKLGIFIHILNL